MRTMMNRALPHHHRWRRGLHCLLSPVEAYSAWGFHCFTFLTPVLLMTSFSSCCIHVQRATRSRRLHIGVLQCEFSMWQQNVIILLRSWRMGRVGTTNYCKSNDWSLKNRPEKRPYDQGYQLWRLKGIDSIIWMTSGISQTGIPATCFFYM